VTKSKPKYSEVDASEEAIDLLKGILEKDPSKRLSIAQIKKHKWLKASKKPPIIFTDHEKQKIDSEF
jgi:serine/threonine protein kinase